jgi:hypothetical protein
MQALRLELGSLNLVWKEVVSIADRPKVIWNLRRNGKLLRMRLNLDAGGLGTGCVSLRWAGHSGLSGFDLCRTQRTLSQPAVSRACAGVNPVRSSSYQKTKSCARLISRDCGNDRGLVCGGRRRAGYETPTGGSVSPAQKLYSLHRGGKLFPERIPSTHWIFLRSGNFVEEVITFVHLTRPVTAHPN